MDNRETLIQKSLDLFASRGYDAVGVQEICEDAGVTKPTLYHYFGSKRGLLDAIIDQYGMVLVDRIKSASVYSGNLPQTLEKIAFAIFRFAEENKVFYRMKLSVYFAPMESESNRAFLRLDEQVFGILGSLMNEAIPIYGNIRGREKITAALFLGAINTCIGLWMNGHMELTDENIRQSLRIVQYGFYN